MKDNLISVCKMLPAQGVPVPVSARTGISKNNALLAYRVEKNTARIGYDRRARMRWLNDEYEEQY